MFNIKFKKYLKSSYKIEIFQVFIIEKFTYNLKNLIKLFLFQESEIF